MNRVRPSVARRGISLAVLSCLVLTSLRAQSPRAVLPHSAAIATVRAQLDTLLSDPAMRDARFGFVLREPGSAHALVEHRASEGYITASNMKLVSSAVSLEVLGKDFSFETRVVGHGELSESVFDGDLVLVGSGDPTLGGHRWMKGEDAKTFPRRVAEALKARGIRKITGRIIGDDSCQPDEIMGLGWDWSYHADWYAAQVGGLCYNENCIDILVSGKTAGQLATFVTRPDTRYVSWDFRVRVVDGKSSGITWSRTLGTNHIVLTGSVPVGTSNKVDWGSVHNPTAFAATVLREGLQAAGIHVGGGAIDRDEIGEDAAPIPTATEVLVRHRSPTLDKIVRVLNKRSQNLYAEQLPRRAARARGGDGSMASVRKLVRQELTRLGVNLDRFVMADGSGLSRLNLVAPRQLAALLSGMTKSKNFDLYFDSLPIAGIDGTLKGRFKEGSAARGRVRAKTGYVGRTVGLSGYVPRQDRPPLVFSILVNDFLAPTAKIKRLVDRLVDTICEVAGS